jgi:hypothetical protein
MCAKNVIQNFLFGLRKEEACTDLSVDGNDDDEVVK